MHSTTKMLPMKCKNQRSTGIFIKQAKTASSVHFRIFRMLFLSSSSFNYLTVWSHYVFKGNSQRENPNKISNLGSYESDLHVWSGSLLTDQSLTKFQSSRWANVSLNKSDLCFGQWLTCGQSCMDWCSTFSHRSLLKQDKIRYHFIRPTTGTCGCWQQQQSR